MTIYSKLRVFSGYDDFFHGIDELSPGINRGSYMGNDAARIGIHGLGINSYTPEDFKRTGEQYGKCP